MWVFCKLVWTGFHLGCGFPTPRPKKCLIGIYLMVKKVLFFPRGKTRNESFTERKKVIFDHQIQHFFLFLKHWFHVCEQRASRENLWFTNITEVRIHNSTLSPNTVAAVIAQRSCVKSIWKLQLTIVTWNLKSFFCERDIK